MCLDTYEKTPEGRYVLDAFGNVIWVLNSVIVTTRNIKVWKIFKQTRSGNLRGPFYGMSLKTTVTRRVSKEKMDMGLGYHSFHRKRDAIRWCKQMVSFRKDLVFLRMVIPKGSFVVKGKQRGLLAYASSEIREA